MKLNIFIFILTVLFVGCSSSQQTINMDAKPIVQVLKKQPIIHRRKGTLYSRQGSSLFADKKDLQVGDILQVIVEEKLKNDSKNSRSTSKSNSSALGGGLITPMTDNSIGRDAKKLTGRLNQNLGIGFNSSTANSFSGTSKSAVDEQFSTTISVIIEQTYQNGNYFIKGSREMLIDGQKQSMEISGVIRPYDITPDNTVYSHQVANLKIKYFKNGEEVDNLHKSWGTKIIETIWPF
jgi:flagellar L-ring protein precursor FlgH